MDFEIEYERILINPQTDEDEAYIEDALGLKKAEYFIPLKSVNTFNPNSLAYLEAEKEE